MRMTSRGRGYTGRPEPITTDSNYKVKGGIEKNKKNLPAGKRSSSYEHVSVHRSKSLKFVQILIFNHVYSKYKASGLCDNRSTTTGQQVSAKPRVCLQMLIINLSENITDAQTLIIMSVGTFQNNLKSFI